MLTNSGVLGSFLAPWDMPPEISAIFAFASFVLDPANRRLAQNGIPVRVNNQILDLLELLLVNAGELVTREQIRRSLWPGQEFVGHEKIITNAVSRLRHILRDDPVSPRYIESIPKKGYRFVAKVSRLEASVLATAQISAGEPKEETFVLSAEARPLAEALPDVTHRAPRIRWRKPSWLYAALILLLAPLLWWWRVDHRAPVSPEAISLGIAPFEASGEGAKELAESFRLDLTDSLAQLPHVNVRAAHSLELFSLDEATFRERANKLGLDALLLGHFVLDGEECHLELELVRGKDLVHIATFRHTASREELASVRDKIQMETFSSLKLTRSEDGALPQRPIGGTLDPRAYDAYLRAGYHLSQQSKDSLQLAIKEYGDAISIDPQFAKAYAAQARAYFFLEQNNLIPEQEGFQKASEAAHRALTLDPSSAEAHAVLGLGYFLHDWNPVAGEKELRQAVLMEPNQPFYHQGLALIFNDEGRFSEALAEIDAAHASDPFWVSAYITEAHVASVARDIPHAQSSMRKLMELMPDSPHARDAIGNAEWNLGRHLEAIASWREMAVMEGDMDRVAMEDQGLKAFRKGGVQAYARIRLAAIASGKGVQSHSNDFVPSEWYAYAGETDAALKAIRLTYANHGSYVTGLAVLPAYSGLQGNAEFQSFLAQLGFHPVVRDHRPA